MAQLSDDCFAFGGSLKPAAEALALIENASVPIVNIEIVPFNSYNILNLFYQSDMLITDFSSTIFEYLIMNKPIIQTHYYTLGLKLPCEY